MIEKSQKDKTAYYVAFLRGINVGGHNKISMDDLRGTFESIGFQNVKTILATGNVVFKAARAAPLHLAARIKKCLTGAIARDIEITVRSVDELVALVDTAPFENVPETKDTKFYVTFFSRPRERKIPIDLTRKEQGFDFVHSTRNEVCTALDLSLAKTPDLMVFLDEEVGSDVTTRTWKTLARVLKTAGR
jgi:uncharacterized protein (DUF1697 family)